MVRVSSAPQFAGCHRRSSACGSRAGVVILEAILAIPILVLVVMAAFEYGTIMIVHQAMQAAVTEGAREAAKVPTTVGAADGNRVLLAIQDVVTDVLGTQGVTLANSQIIVEDSDNPGIALNNGVRNSGPAVGAVPGASGITNPAELRVTIRVELANTRIPNLLGTFGINLTTRNFDVSSVSRRDCL